MPKEFVILADADNTLWDTDSLFAEAQLQLLSRVEIHIGRLSPSEDRLAFVRAYDQALASHHHLHLKYPPKMLVEALAGGLTRCPPDKAANDVIAGRHSLSVVSSDWVDDAVREYLDRLSSIPKLLPFVNEGIQLAITSGVPVYVITEGRSEKQRKILSEYNVEAAFKDVWELTKNTAQFLRLKKRFEGRNVVVIGDQPDRDIAPAHQAGCLTVLVPSRFRPKWHNKDEYLMADFVATDFSAAINWVISQKVDG